MMRFMARVLYFQSIQKFKHYGRSLEILIKQAVELEDKEDQKGAVVAIGVFLFAQVPNSVACCTLDLPDGPHCAL